MYKTPALETVAGVAAARFRDSKTKRTWKMLVKQIIADAARERLYHTLEGTEMRSPLGSDKSLLLSSTEFNVSIHVASLVPSKTIHFSSN
jgi:hypothetical protein